MAYSVPLFDLNYDEAEERAVLEVLRSMWISMGPKTAELERAFATHVGAKHALAVSNCTVALHLALAALELRPGDEVIVPSLTFVATVNCVGYVGATPVFADVTSCDDFSIDPEHVRKLIGPRTRAIIPMHYGGFPCNMDRLLQIAREHNLFLVEDAAHAPDTRYQGRAAGTFGDLGCFSFYANKNVCCGEGGMIVTNRDDLAERIRLMRSHGMTTLSFDRARGHATEYDVVARGFDFRTDDIHSALVLAQLGKLADDTARRIQVRRQYVEKLALILGIHVPYEPCEHQSSHYILPVLIKEGGASRRNAIRHALAQQGIQTSVHYPPAHRFAIYRSANAQLPMTEHVADHEITLPLFSRMTEAMVNAVTDALRKSLQA
jgi:dTDP-4-amino-4,6-dideoxygalactose transaminase